MTILGPAEGKDYKTAKEVKHDYYSGKVFEILVPSKQGGIQVTCRDFVNETVTISYHRERRVCTAKFNELDDARYTGE